MRKKFGVFKEKYSHIISMLEQGYPYTDVIVDLKNNHQLDLSFNTFRSYLYRYRKELNQEIHLPKNVKSTKSDLNDLSTSNLKNTPQSLDHNDDVKKPKQIFKNRKTGEEFIHKLLNQS